MASPTYVGKRMKHIANQIAEIIDALHNEKEVFAATALDQVLADLDFVRRAYFSKAVTKPNRTEIHE